MVEKVKEMSLGDDFGDVRPCPVANHGAIVKERAQPQIGDRMPDGTIYAGISPSTGVAMYTVPRDAPLMMKWKPAMDYAAALDAHGQQDWRLPTEAELEVLFANRDKEFLKGTFNKSGSHPSGWYWSSTEAPGHPGLAWVERFNDGYRSWGWTDFDASVRPVRSGP